MKENDINKKKVSKIPLSWERASMYSEDMKIVICYSGHYSREYSVEHPDYQKVLDSLVEKYPEFGPGKSCSEYHFQGGGKSTEITEF